MITDYDNGLKSCFFVEVIDLPRKGVHLVHPQLARLIGMTKMKITG